jgi:hypothetical protein
MCRTHAMQEAVRDLKHHQQIMRKGEVTFYEGKKVLLLLWLGKKQIQLEFLESCNAFVHESDNADQYPILCLVMRKTAQ